jgi:transposase
LLKKGHNKKHRNDKNQVNVALVASQENILLELSKVSEIHLGEKRKLSEIPNKVLKLAESFEMDIFPKRLRS